MTAEYLDRSSLVARMKYYEEHTTEESGEHYAYSVALREIRNAPAADVAEVVYGQWEGEGDGYADGEIVLDVWHCSQCGYCIDDGTDNPACLPKYCPNCGAKMDGGFDDATS